MSIPELAAELNLHAAAFRLGRLQEIRLRLRGLRKVPIRGIFSSRTIHPNYAFHDGGRRELQFNIAEEEWQDRTDMIRYGVAFALQKGKALPTLDPLVPKIARFNEYVCSHLEDFAGWSMWYHRGGSQSDLHPVAPIPDALVEEGTFIMLGRLVPCSDVDPLSILAHLDRLLPLYIYVESGEVEPPSYPDLEGAEGGDCPEFKPGCPQFLEGTTAQGRERTVDVALWHNTLQLALYQHLCHEFGSANVQMERPLPHGGFVDAAVRRNHLESFYEVKVAKTVRLCVRNALGQLIEYAHWPSTDRASEIVVVGEALVDPDSKAYLRLLREELGLRLWYRRINVEGNLLEKRV